jgi:hypothetical protein
MSDPPEDAPDAPAGPAAVIGVLTASADLTVTPPPDPEDTDG